MAAVLERYRTGTAFRDGVTMTLIAHAPLHSSVLREDRSTGIDSVPQDTLPASGRGATGIPGTAPGVVRLEFFGMGIQVSGLDLAYLQLQFGPHICAGATPEPATLQVNLTPMTSPGVSSNSTVQSLFGQPTGQATGHSAGYDEYSLPEFRHPESRRHEFHPQHQGVKDQVNREISVARADGVIILRRAFSGWSNVPPPIPPFAAMVERYSVMPAVVMAKGDRVLALAGSPRSSKAAIALSLLQHGWRFVSGQLLVTERKTGRTLPFLAPLDLQGVAAEQTRRRGLPDGSWQVRNSTLDGQTLQVRPEALGAVVPVRAQGGPATIVRLCDSQGDRLVLRESDRCPQTWPTEAHSALRHRGLFELQMPDRQAVEEAANCLDANFTPPVNEDRKVVPIKPFLPSPRA